MADIEAKPGTSSAIEDPPQNEVKTAKRTKAIKKSTPKIEEPPSENLGSPESKQSMINNPLNVTTGKHENLTYNVDIIWTAVDEIALEGLDGITLEALWKRISATLGQPLPFNKALEIFIWDSIRQMNDITFYKLPVARETLFICDRYKNCDAETGHVIEMDDLPPDIYPISIVKDPDNNILGSCLYYKEREEISAFIKSKNLEEAIELGNKMVIVASQKLRSNALVPNTSNPLVNLCDTSYCILERIGRSRYIGELTCGKASLALICKDAKTSFYYRKILLKNNLITKQPFCLRTTNRQNTIGNMFHLQRFYNERKARKQMMIEQIVTLLKSRPNYRMEYMELRRLVGDENWEKMGFVKLIKSEELRQIVRTDLNLLYREVYPNATPNEWKRKICSKEKLVRVLELINPNSNVALAKDDDAKDSSSDEEAIGNQLMRVPDSKQMYDLIYNSGRTGMFLKQLQKLYGLDFYTVRAIIKLLLRKNLITSHMVDSGRQRYSKYYAKCFDKEEVYQKFLEQSENPKSTSESETDDETLDFIAKTLKVDSAKLKKNKVDNSSKNPKEDVKLPNEYKNKYHLVKEIRVRNTCFDKSEKFKVKPDDASDNLERLDDKKLLLEIYSNQHDYVSHEESVENNLIIQSSANIKITSSFTNICSGVFNVKHKEPIHHSISSTTKLTAQARHPKFVPIMKFRKFSHPLNLLFLKTPNSFARSYKIYFAKVETLLATLTADAEADKENPTNLLSSDEDDIVDDSDSIAPVGFENVQARDNCDEAKNIIINNFETSTRLAEHFGVTPEITSKRKATLEASAPAKKIKLEVEPNIVPTAQHTIVESNASDITEANQKVTEQSNAELNVTIEDKDSIVQGDIFDATMESFMGPKPVLVCQDFDEDNVETRVVMSSNVEDFTDTKIMTMSERVQKRVECITEAVTKHKVISDLSKLLQMIILSERTEGYNVTVDRKSLVRIYAKLVREGVIKMVKILVKYENIIRSKNIIIHPDVDVQTVVKPAIEQFKLSFVLYAKRKVQEDPNAKPEVTSDDVKLQESENEKPFMEGKFDLKTENKVNFRYSRTIGRSYGYYPKIAKMRILHEFLYYLLYSYDGAEIPSAEVKDILTQHYDSVDNKLVKECSTLYQKEASWKMFIPPLPEYKNWTDGWLLICDALLRLPLSIFVKIFNVSYIIPELPKYYLNHPIRKHFLVRNIPPNIRDAILSYRKYIFAIHEVFSLLCYLGILQFGPQKFREKDQLFIYLNKNALLYDTTTSEAGYHHISESDYPALKYNFKSTKEVDKYWNDMYRISMNTKLGQRTTVLGKYISLENIHSKKEMIEILKPQTPESAAARDIAYLPGDHLGACCADSALWLHVKRNWVWTTQRNKICGAPTKQMITGIRKKHLEDVKPLKFTDCFKQSVKSTMVKSTSSHINRSRKVFTKPGMTFKKKAILRKMVPRKPTKKNAEVDSIDKEILKSMGKSRATFCKEEDNLIFLCRAVVEYLCPYNRKRVVVHSAVRDFIHRILPYSRKTSTAYKRRIIQLKKQENLQEENQTFSFNLGSDFFTQKHFRRIRDKIVDVTSTIGEKEMSLTFLYLAYYIYKQWKLNPKSKTLEADSVKDYLNISDIPKYHEALTLNDEDSFYQDPTCEDDINLDTIKSVIHSSLGYQNASHEWPYQLLKVYQSFSEHLLRTALNSLRDQQLISGKKASTKHSGGKEGSILMRGTSYHLSFAYTFKQITKYPNYIFNEAHDFFVGLHNNISKVKTTGQSVENFAQGHGLGLGEIALHMAVSYAFYLPDDLISLDPSVNDHRDLVKELALRYKTLVSKKNQDNDIEENAPEDPDVNRLETALTSLIRSEFSEDAVAKEKMQEEFDNFASLFNQKQASESSDDMQMNADRRQKGLRISDLAFLLTKGLFPELDDDDRLEKLNRHFMVRYPTCNFYLADQPIDSLLLEECHSVIIKKAEKILAGLKKGCIIQNSMPSEDEVVNALNSSGGKDVDKMKADEILNFIYAKNMFGASSEELRKHFEIHGSLTLDQLLEALIKSGMIIRAGVTNFAFVHFSYRHNWSIYLDSSKNPDLETNSVGYRVIIAPWIKIDGSIHLKVLNNWLNIILSHCLSFPFIPLGSLCKRFCYIKPIDVFAVLEILQELTCLRIMSYESSRRPSLFSEDTEILSGPARITDDFKKIFIETDDMAIIKFGSYLDKDKVEFNVPFEE